MKSIKMILTFEVGIMESPDLINFKNFVTHCEQ